jgi:DNA-binding LacI/PurR family transcriptional regulator
VLERNERAGRATIRDVAERAGVSISTVSHAFSGGRPISEKTRLRVRQAAHELSYRPDPTARSLRRSKTGIIGLVVRPKDAIQGSLRGTETFARFMGAVATQVLERNLGLIHVPDILSPAATQVPMDGCIVAYPYGNDEVLAELENRHVPVVTVDEHPGHSGSGWSVNLDYEPAIVGILDRMKQQGARRIMLLSGTENNAWNRRPQELYANWVSHNQAEHLHVALYEGEGAEGAEKLMAAVLSQGDAPDAIITGPSTFARGVLEAFSRRGLSSPRDYLLAALTDSEYTRSAVPSITAVDLALERMAAASVELMMQRLAGSDEPEAPVLISPDLRLRESTSR